IPAQDDDVQEHAKEEVATDVLDTCSALVLRVEGLETANAAQQLEIVKLKAMVKKLERLNTVKSSKLRCLKKVGTSQRVESLDDLENVFNQGMISVDMDQDEGVELVVDQEKNAEIEGRQADKQAKIYNIDLDHSSKVLSMQEDDTEVQEAVEVVTTAKLIIEVVTAATQVVAASTPISATKPKELHTDTPAETPTVKDKGKGILIEDPKPIKKKDQVEMDAEYAKKLQEELNKEHEKAYKNIDWNAAFDHVQAKETQEEMEKEDEEIIKSINKTPAHKAAKRIKLSVEAQKADNLRIRLEIVQDEDDDVFVEAVPLAQKVPVVDYQVVVIDNKPKYKIIRAYDTYQFYISFTTLRKNFDREDLETLWRIVKDRFSTKKPTNFLDEYLLLTLKTMFGELDEQDAIRRNQKIQLFLLVERRYPLSRFTLEQLVNVARLQVEEEIARIEAIRLFLAYASFMGFMVYQMDVKSAFLYGTIEEEVYVCQPLEFEDPGHPDKVYKVVKALYGLHQAPKAWYETLATYLLENGFQKGTIDQTLFIKKQQGDILLVQIYLDDIIFDTTNKDLCRSFEKLMKDKFQMSSMRELIFFLGLQVKQKKDGIFINQNKYVAEILRKFGLTKGKLANTPIDTKKPLLKDPDGEDVDVHTYSLMICSLMYLTSSRPDIMFAVCACARFQVTPKASHLHAVKRIFRHLKGKPHLGLWYPKDLPFDLVAYTDSDYAGASLDRKSTTGGCQFLRCRLIS
nr:putative ribonuclease H-like domain-containing protein [Tanacetum cinerariifolium]GEZ90984.1 putative ribonuclease H-like domain-containing protein [Tanacetum cinerariifolium]